MVWHFYKQALTRHPLLVKATTAATLMSISDVLVQAYEQQSGDTSLSTCNRESVPTTSSNGLLLILILQANNWLRTLHVGVTGLIFSGPITHAWYGILERLVERLPLKSSVSTLATKLLLDAILFSPIAVAGYFIWRSVLEGSHVGQKLQRKWFSSLQASWSFWPLANTLNFAFVPLPYRVLYNNALSLLWNAYLSNANQGYAGVTREQQAVKKTRPMAIGKDTGTRYRYQPTRRAWVASWKGCPSS
ncbi:Protein Mpv17 [Seminavis robusta]|uniref:Protein Mpv17 n=1 Tax=Seminavis robusta TaxID=568900 RepID=A0A9N8HIM9_9STRA|nr:Protein Mpv17 [Seminavis robusta]|eukprot:Sro709_g190800.1 Protein Mpv17 (247) ;mRNA; f:10482-11222